MRERQEGLSDEELRYLNSTAGIEEFREQRAQKIMDLKKIYKNDPLAIEELGIFGDDPEYYQKIEEVLEAARSNNAAELRRIKAWFQEHYPLSR